jgi:uncharacterized protein (DUF362 family)
MTALKRGTTMSVPTNVFGSTTIARVTNSDELRKILTDPWLNSETIVIKPNWVSTEPGDFTDVDALRILFETLDARLVVVESYMLGRSMNLQDNGMSFTAGDKEVNWRWLLKGDGWNWLIENPSWEWFQQGGHWDQIRVEDNAFLEKYGFRDLFDEYNVSYINVTEEVWSGRIADPDEVKQSVESRFKPVKFEKLYHSVPQKIFDLRGSTFISFARLKMYASFTFKNQFGLYPDPLRPWWHGQKNSRIVKSIIDINKVYHALFNVYGICEALNTNTYLDPDGEYLGIYCGRYRLSKGLGTIIFSRDLVSLDAILLNLSDPSKRWIAALNRTIIDQAQEEFGEIDEEAVKGAKLEIGCL